MKVATKSRVVCYEIKLVVMVIRCAYIVSAYSVNTGPLVLYDYTCAYSSLVYLLQRMPKLVL